MDPRFLETLGFICERLDGLPAPWALTGSLGMLLQGMPLQPHDIDLQSDREGAALIEERLPEFLVRPLDEKITERMRSWLAAFEIDGVQVEVLGDSRKREPGQKDWRPPVDLPRVIHFARSGSLRVPVLSLAYEADAYAAMGRAEKAAMLSGWAETHPEMTAITNYRLISPNLATAGMPAREQIPLIAAEGYRTVINLAVNDSPNVLEDEDRLVEAQGMEYVHIPVIWEHPTPENAACFFDALDERRDRPVFVHCVMNYRVSALVYLYRVLRLGVPAETAWKDVAAIWEPEGVWVELIDSVIRNS